VSETQRKYPDALVATWLDRHAAGESYGAIARAHDIPRQSVHLAIGQLKKRVAGMQAAPPRLPPLDEGRRSAILALAGRGFGEQAIAAMLRLPYAQVRAALAETQTGLMPQGPAPETRRLPRAWPA
jgi:DNA-directed RNA polymerase specialized sigma24 family protein